MMVLTLACVGGQLGAMAGIAFERVFYIDAGAGVLGVLDLGFGQGGAVVDAPVDRLETLVDEPLSKKAKKFSMTLAS